MLYRLTAPSIPLLGLHEVKTHLRLDHALEDEYLQNLILSATEWVEHEIGRALLYQTWVKVCQPSEKQATIEIELNYPPLVEIVSIQALLPDGAQKPIKRYSLNTNFLMPRLSLGYHSHPLAITYRCGYGERPNTVPAPLRYAVLTVITQFYENRSQTVDLKTVQTFLNPFRIMRLR